MLNPKIAKEPKNSNLPCTHDCESVSQSTRLPADMTVSEETKNFLECLLLLFDLYGKVSDAIEAVYGESQAEAIVEKQYFPAHKALENVISELLTEVILYNISLTGIEKIQV
jgi:hypothetical protein